MVLVRVKKENKAGCSLGQAYLATGKFLTYECAMSLILHVWLLKHKEVSDNNTQVWISQISGWPPTFLMYHLCIRRIHNHWIVELFCRVFTLQYKVP